VSNVFQKYKEFHPLIQFVINGILFSLFWILFYHTLRYTSVIDPLYNKLSNGLTYIVLHLSKNTLGLMGYKTVVRDTLIYIVDAPKGIDLLRGCLGRNLMGILTGLIIAFPGAWKNKLWYIPTGLFLIVVINIIRVVALVYNANCCPETSQFNHDVFFNYNLWFNIFAMGYLGTVFQPLQKKEEKITPINLPVNP